MTDIPIDSVINGNFAILPTSDSTPPHAIVDLAANSPMSNTLNLSWTAPGDDGDTGTASQYDIRYSTVPITMANWNAATPVTGEPAPVPAGITQTMMIQQLSPETTYYFAMKSADEVPNWSVLSNEVQIVTKEIIPGIITRVYPNPYRREAFLSERIYFGDLPPAATIRIYSLHGTLLKVIRHQSAIPGGREEWDISGIASGVYIYYTESSQGSQKGKISIVK